jgi:acyl transferase domain-containing protein/acyl carrier protein
VEAPAQWTLPLSGRTAEACRAAARRLAEALAPHAQLVSQRPLLRDVCGSAATRREHHAHRACVMGDSVEALVDALNCHAAGQDHPHLITGQADLDQSPLALTFVYSGMGPQWWGMGRQLREAEPIFRTAFDRCVALYDGLAGGSLQAALGEDASASRIAEPDVAQPANFALQVALTELLRSWGIQPRAIVGHSAGEPAAAYAAGVLSLEEATRVIYHRSRLQQSTKGQGRLLAVGLASEQTQAHLDALGERSLSLAAVNGPTAVTVVGSDAAIETLGARLEGQGVFTRALRVQVPYHSVYMEPLRDEMLASLADLKLAPAQVPLYSTVTGGRVDGTEMDAAYWYRNMREPVLFMRAVQALLGDGYDAFVELAPHPVLSGSVREVAQQRGVDAAVVHCLRRDDDEAREMRRVIAGLHVLGQTIDWAAFQGRGAWTRLPTYPWGGGRYWHETPASRRIRSSEPEHPILATRVDAPTPTWEVDIESPQLGFLEDHRIQGAVVFPGAGYIEMAAHAARSLYGGLDAVEFGDISFVKALYLSPDQPVTLRLSVDPASQVFTIASSGYGQDRGSWQIHCTGRLRLSQPTEAQAADINVLRALCPQEIPRAACYRHFRSLGLEYGEAFQGIAQLWQGQDRALARIEVPAELAANLDRFNVHPAVLDVCFQTLAAALPMRLEGSAVYMPVAVHEGRVHAPLTSKLWIHARISQIDALGMSGDIEMLDERGRRLLEIRQCRARALGDDPAALVASPQSLFKPEWIACDRRNPDRPSHKGLWLVYGGDAELCQSTLAALRRSGCAAMAVADLTDADHDALQVDPGDASSWGQALSTARSQGGEVRGVIHLGAASVAPVPATAQEVASRIARVTDGGSVVIVALAQALARHGAEQAGAQRPRLWIATRGTQAVAGHGVTDPLNAAAWGLARVLGHGEHIDIWGGIVDLPGEPAARDGTLIAAECLGGEGEDQVAWRDHQRYVLRLRPCAPEDGLPSPPALRANATYLITGGLGALGLVVARWMVERGARHLLLLGREGLPPRERWTDPDVSGAMRQRIAAVRGIEAAGCSVRAEPLDIADPVALRTLIETHERAGYPPIRGVMHAAGVARPQLIAQMSAEDIHAALPAKVHGAWNLHLAFAAQPLDFFVLYSSIASLVISVGQGSYAAANAALDALAHYRRAQGLAATSINWGPWGDVGMATQLDLLKYFHGRGFHPMTSAQGCEALGKLLSGRCVQAAVLGSRWQTVADTSPLGIPAPMLEDVLRDEAAAQSLARIDEPALGGNFSLCYRACAEESERRALVLRELRDQVCRVLRVEDAALGNADTLNSHGMDSMMAIELKNRIERAMGVRIAIVDLLKGVSVEAIAARIAPELDAIALSVNDSLAEIVAAMKDMSPAEVEALLAADSPTEEPQ